MAKKDGQTPEERAQARAAKLAKEFNGELEKQKNFLHDIANAVLGIDMSSFYEATKLTTDQINQLKGQMDKVQESIKDATASFTQGFAEAIRGNRVAISKLARDHVGISRDMANAMRDVIKTQDFASFYEKYGDAGVEMFQKITKGKGFTQFEKWLRDGPKEMRKQKAELQALAKIVDDKVIVSFKGWGAVAKKLAENFASNFKFDKLIANLLNFDQVLNEAQRDTGIQFDQNEARMTTLTVETARFGLSIKDTTELMGGLSTQMRTTNFKVLADAAQDMAAMSRATGLSNAEVGELGGQMMMYGRTSKEVVSFTERTMKTANIAGVNGRKVMQDIGKNLEKFKKMGFQGGEESLKKMVITANRLGQSIDEIFDMSERARNIEGAMEMAAELQLAGGSFSNINPMDLLAAARKGPAELQKILGRMGADIGSFNQKTGELELDAVDFDRLNIVAKTTGMSVESLRKQLQRTAEDNQKAQFLPQNLMEGLDSDQQAFLMSAINMKDKSVNLGLDGIDSIDDLAKLTPEMIKTAADAAYKDKQNLEEQALQNTSLTEAKNAFIASITNLFTFLQPVVSGLTDFVNKINSMGAGFKIALAGVVASLMLVYGFAKQYAAGISFGKGHAMGLKGGGLFSSLKNMFGGGQKNISATAPNTGQLQTQGKGPGSWLTSLGGGLKFIGKNSGEILKGAATLALSTLMIGASLVALTAGIAAFGGDATGGQLVTFGTSLVGMAGMLWLMSKIVGRVSPKDILIGSLAMVAIGAAMIPFAFAAQMMAQTDWGTTLATVAIAMGTVLGLTAIGALLMSPAGLAFLVGAVALVGAGIAMAAFGGSLLIAAAGFRAMQTVDWGMFPAMGSALASFIPSLLGIAGAGIFAIPGLLLMTATLAGFAGVMVILAPALSKASASIAVMAQGVAELKSSIQGMDTSSLEKLADVSERLAVASAFNALANVVGGGGGGSKVEKIQVEPITINLEFDNATLRKIQTKTLDATRELT